MTSDETSTAAAERSSRTQVDKNGSNLHIQSSISPAPSAAGCTDTVRRNYVNQRTTLLRRQMARETFTLETCSCLFTMRAVKLWDSLLLLTSGLVCRRSLLTSVSKVCVSTATPGRGAGPGPLGTAVPFTLLPNLGWHLPGGLHHSPRLSLGCVVGAPSMDVARLPKKMRCGACCMAEDEIRARPSKPRTCGGCNTLLVQLFFGGRALNEDFGNFTYRGGKANNMHGKAWEEHLSDDVGLFNPAGLCCQEDHNIGMDVNWHAQRESHKRQMAG